MKIFGEGNVGRPFYTSAPNEGKLNIVLSKMAPFTLNKEGYRCYFNDLLYHLNRSNIKSYITNYFMRDLTDFLIYY